MSDLQTNSKPLCDLPRVKRVKVHIEYSPKYGERLFLIDESATGLTDKAPVCRFFDQHYQLYPDSTTHAQLLADSYNAIADFPEPKMMRETWEIVKELELDKYYKLKEKYDELQFTIKRLSQTFLKGKTAKEITDWLRNECNQALEKVKEDSNA